MNTKRLIWGYVLYVILAVVPLVVTIALDWKTYTATPARTISLSLAGSVAMLMIVLQATGHMPGKVKRVVVYAVVAGLLWALRPIIQSLAILMTAMTAGELAALLVARPIIERARKRMDDERLAGAVSKGVEEVIKGRV